MFLEILKKHSITGVRCLSLRIDIEICFQLNHVKITIVNHSFSNRLFLQVSASDNWSEI